MKFQALSLMSSVALLALSTPAFAQLSKPEAKMAATVDAEYERSVALLERMVNQNSGTMNFAGVKTVGDMMRASIDGKPVGFLKSSGIAHPTKSKVEFGCMGQDGYIDDVKIWNAEPAKN
jgi:hypothetical protein